MNAHNVVPTCFGRKIGLSLALFLWVFYATGFAQEEFEAPSATKKPLVEKYVYDGMAVEQFLKTIADKAKNIKIGQLEEKSPTFPVPVNANSNSEYLYAGWNLLYIYTTNNLSRSSLPGINPQLFYLEKGKLIPETGNLQSGKTYLVRVSSSGYVNLSGGVRPLDDIPLTTGWNTVGFLVDMHLSNISNETDAMAITTNQGEVDTLYSYNNVVARGKKGYLIRAKYNFTTKCSKPKFSPALLDFGNMQQGSNDTKYFDINSVGWNTNIQNIPIMDLVYSFDNMLGWASINTNSGTVLRNESDRIYVTVNTANLPPGVTQGSIYMEDPNDLDDGLSKWKYANYPIKVNVISNESITTPSRPSGPSSAKVDQSLNFNTGGSTSNLGHSIEYKYDWGDGSQQSWGSSSRSHSYSSPGTYNVRAKARCQTHTNIESVWSSSKAVTITYCQLSISIVPTGTGTVSKSPNKTNFTWNETVKLTANPNSGYVFDGWIINSNNGGDTNPITLTMNEDKNVTAHFLPPETVSTPNHPSGPSNGKVEQDLSFTTGGSSSNYYGHQVEYRFEWGDGNTSSWGSSSRIHSYSSAGTYNVRAKARCQQDTNVESNWSTGKSVTITYCQLSISIKPSGSGSVAKSPNKSNFSWNEAVQLTANPKNSGWQFDYWSGALGGSTNPKNLPMSGDKSVTAHFKTISQAPTIALSASSLNPSCSQGTNAADETFEVWNSGGGTLSYSISINKNWLYCTPTSGTSTGGHNDITVHYNTSGLSVGTHNATVKISSGNASNSPQELNVNLTVSSNPIISGHVTNTTGDGISGVTISFAGSPNYTYTTNQFGFYHQEVPTGWSGTVTPSYPNSNALFDPPSQAFQNVTTSKTQNFTVKDLSISGYVNHYKHTIIAGVDFTFTDDEGRTKTARTDNAGSYDVKVPFHWSGTLKPERSGYHFSVSPSNRADHRAYSNLKFHQHEQDFIGYDNTMRISGHVKDSDGNPLQNVEMSYTGFSAVKLTDATGYYERFVDAPYTGTVTPSFGDYEFQPPDISYKDESVEQENQDYVGAIHVHQITYSVIPLGAGEIKITPNKTTYTHNETVQIEAEPNTGYRFVEWHGDLAGEENVQFLKIDENKNVVAEFIRTPVYDVISNFTLFNFEAWIDNVINDIYINVDVSIDFLDYNRIENVGCILETEQQIIDFNFFTFIEEKISQNKFRLHIKVKPKYSTKIIELFIPYIETGLQSPGSAVPLPSLPEPPVYLKAITALRDDGRIFEFPVNMNEPLPTVSSNSLVNRGRVTYTSAMCPVSLQVIDIYGRQVGSECNNGELFIKNEIPSAFYFENTNNDSKHILLFQKEPSNSIKEIKVTAYEQSQFDQNIILSESDNLSQTVFFDDISLSEGGTAAINLQTNNPDYTMQIDTDGDGQVDTTRAPDTHTFTGEGLAVWPGDTDNNGIVNQADILPIGLHWQKTGPERTVDNKMQWVRQSATPWTPNQKATYADANGDGIVNQADMLAVGLNWGKQHSASQTMLAKQSVSARPSGALQPILRYDESEKEIQLTLLAKDFSDVFGLALEMNYPPEKLQVVAVEPGGLFGNDAIFYYKTATEDGTIGVAFSIKAGQATGAQSGALVRINMKSKSSAANVTNDELSVKNIQAVNVAGDPVTLNLVPFSDSSPVSSAQPEAFALFPNYPNPFNPTTTISYALPKSSHVQLHIFDLRGRLVRTLLDAQQDAGHHFVQWDAADEKGTRVASGIYISRLTAGQMVLHRKLVLIR